MYGVFFRADELSFLDPDEFATPEVKSWKVTVDATGELAAAGAGVALGGAPLASWALARLAAISESSLFPGEFVRREGELGGFRIRMLVARGAGLIARVRLAAEAGVAGLSATAADRESAEAAARGLIVALAREPGDLGRCRVEVCARELGGHRNEYGYDGSGLLGRANVYE